MDTQKYPTNEVTIQFIDINDDCFYKIFEYLPVSDLCSTSFTCKRLQTLAQHYFGQKYPKEWITIDISLNARGNTEMEFSKTDPNKVLKYFGKFIRNIRMQSSMDESGWIDLGLLYDFLKNECCDKLHSLELNLGSRIDLNSMANDESKMQFHSIESVKIIDVECVHSTYNGLLQLCANLKSLKFATSTNNNVYEWLRYIYPNLELLKLPWNRGQKPESIQDFLQNHQQLKDITCEGIHLRYPRFQNFQNIHRLVFRAAGGNELINIIQKLKANKTITFLAVKLGICDGSIQSIITDLNAIQPINKLEYDPDWKSFRLPYLEYLYEFNMNYNVTLLDRIPECAPYLKSIKLNFLSRKSVSGQFVEGISVRMVKSLQHLNKLSFAFQLGTVHEILSQTDLNELEVTLRRVRSASHIDFHFYFGRKSNEGLPPNLVSSGNTFTANYHYQPKLYKSVDDFFEYDAAEVIFG